MRVACGLILALLAVMFALPAELSPLAARARVALGGSGLLWSLIIAVVLAFAGLLLPPARRVTTTTLDHAGLTVALLLLLEPVLHLAVLAVSQAVATPISAEALLPLVPPTLGWALLVQALVFVVIVPIGEEFFFRGRLLPWMQARLGTVSAVTVSAGLFAVAHGDLVKVLIALPVGLLLGTMRVQGASLGACILAHGVHNGLFLVAGPGLIGLPLAAPVLVSAGAVLAAVTWHFHLRPRPGQWRRVTTTAVFALAALIIVAPWWRTWQDAWWSGGTHRLCVRWRIDTSDLLARIIAQERRGRLTEARRQGLVALLMGQPCQTAFRQVGLLALLDPDLIATVHDWEDASHELFDHLAARPPTRYDGDIARRLGLVLPGAMADTILQWPEVLPRWLPLPERQGEAALVLGACQEPRDRRVLLAQWEAMFPGTVLGVVFALPAERMTHMERRHLRSWYRDLDARLAVLASEDPQRAVALGWHEKGTP